MPKPQTTPDDLYNEMCHVVRNTALICHSLCSKALKPQHHDSCLGEIREKMLALATAMDVLQKKWGEIKSENR